MTVRELIEKLKDMPPESQVLTFTGDWGYGLAEAPRVEWARPKEDGWWDVHQYAQPPKFSQGFQHAVIIA